MNKLKHGSKLEDGQAHQHDHAAWSRRSFLQTMGFAGAGGFLLNKLPINAMMSSPLPMALSGANSDNIVVLIQLNGGNDGLNTIVPVYDYGTYINQRPNIGIPQNQLVGLDDAFAMPNSMQNLQGLWQSGKMKVVHGVGYPEQNLSHFRSTDIWSTASNSNEILNTGWLGRHLYDEYPDFANNPPTVPPAIHIGGFQSTVFSAPDNLQMALSVGRPEDISDIIENGSLYDTANLPDDCYYGSQVGYLRGVANTTFQYAEIISDAYNASNNAVEYSGNNNSLGAKLSMLARLIKGNLGTRFYMVTLSGFDTHAQQNQTHSALLQELSTAVNNFYTDLEATGHDKRVLAVTWSEFGRRIEQNASQGTDHGAAAPMLLFGSGLSGNGFVGTPPDLGSVDANGNLIYTTDFRQIYASVLENWLCIDGNLVDNVLGGSNGQYFERIDLGLDCTNQPNTGTSLNAVQSGFKEHSIQRQGNGSFVLYYVLLKDSQVTIDIFDIQGRLIKHLFNGKQARGSQQLSFQLGNTKALTGSGGLASGQFVYRINANGQHVSKVFVNF